MNEEGYLTPEERELYNKMLRENSRFTGVTLDGLINGETYVSINQINKLRNEILEYIDDIDIANEICKLFDNIVKENINA